MGDGPELKQDAERRKPARPPAVGMGRIVRTLFSGNKNRADFMLRAAEDLGDVVRLPVPGKEVFLITHPRDVRRVLVQNGANYRKSFDYKMLARLLGDGLITSEGEVWQTDRRLQQPLFHGKLLEHFFSTVVKCAETMVARWQADTTIRLDSEAARFALHVIGERLLGLDIRDWSDEISHHFDICQKQLVGRVVAPIDFARWLPTPGEARFARSLKELRRIVDELIERRSRLQVEALDMFSVLSEGGQSRERMRDQFLTMTMAGHETSAVALTWTYYCLSSLPEIDARVAEEAARVLGAGSPTHESVAELAYTTQVIQESLRLYPPVAIMGREAIEADELGGYAIPRDGVIALCPYATHRRPDLWERPEEFDPARFSPEQKEKQVPCAYVPFAAGPRGCIGQHLAMFELQTAVSLISRRFRLHLATAGRIQPIPMVSMRPDRPISMRLEARARPAGTA